MYQPTEDEIHHVQRHTGMERIQAINHLRAREILRTRASGRAPTVTPAPTLRQPLDTIRYWINAYTVRKSGDHFLGHGMMVILAKEYLEMREKAQAFGEELERRKTALAEARRVAAALRMPSDLNQDDRDYTANIIDKLAEWASGTEAPCPVSPQCGCAEAEQPCSRKKPAAEPPGLPSVAQQIAEVRSRAAVATPSVAFQYAREQLARQMAPMYAIAGVNPSSQSPDLLGVVARVELDGPQGHITLCLGVTPEGWRVFVNGGLLSDGRDQATFNYFSEAIEFAAKEAVLAVEL